MTDRIAELDAALERVIAAARDAPGRGEGGRRRARRRRGVAGVRRAEQRLARLRRAAPRRLRRGDAVGSRGDRRRTRPTAVAVVTARDGGRGRRADDPYPQVVSVRQRRDYRVPSVSALLRAGRGGAGRRSRRARRRAGRRRSARRCWSCCSPATARSACSTCRSWSPLDGVVIVAEVRGGAATREAHDEADGEAAVPPGRRGPDRGPPGRARAVDRAPTAERRAQTR